MIFDLPDDPIVRNMENTGYPDGKEPKEPHCPVCYEDCETVYITDGNIVGCDRCVKTKDAWSAKECFKEETY